MGGVGVDPGALRRAFLGPNWRGGDHEGPCLVVIDPGSILHRRDCESPCLVAIVPGLQLEGSRAPVSGRDHTRGVSCRKDPGAVP